MLFVQRGTLGVSEPPFSPTLWPFPPSLCLPALPTSVTPCPSCCHRAMNTGALKWCKNLFMSSLPLFSSSDICLLISSFCGWS